MKYVWVHSDYSQAEARVVAWAGPVPALKKWFQEGQDVHLNVAKLIAQVVQRMNTPMPGGLFTGKAWDTYVKSDPERQIAKNTVHGNNYGLGPNKFALITGLPLKYAELIQNIYFKLFPEIKTGYQRFIDDQLTARSEIEIPLGWRRRYYDAPGPDRSRAAYAGYAQSTIGGLLVQVLSDVCEFFEHELRRETIVTPWRIRRMGYDVRINSHDAIESVIPNEPEAIAHYCRVVKKIAQRPLIIRGEECVIPMDFKIGPNLGELKDYHV